MIRLIIFIFNILGWAYYLPVALFNIVKILFISLEHTTDAVDKVKKKEEGDLDINTRLLNEELTNKEYGRLKNEYANLDKALKRLFFWDPNAGLKNSSRPGLRSEPKATQNESDPLKAKGDDYERFIGRQFENKGDLVIYNGLLKGYADYGIDLVVISGKSRSVNLVQCKHWENMLFTLDTLDDIYSKLSRYNIGHYLAMECDEINFHLQRPEENRTILTLLHDSKKFQRRKTLYLSSDKVVDLDVGRNLVMIHSSIFRYKDMKIVIKPMPA